MYSYARAKPGVAVPVFVDGPYGGIDNLKYFGSDRIVVVAGGSGAGWMLPFVEQFLRFHAMVRGGQHVAQMDEKVRDDEMEGIINGEQPQAQQQQAKQTSYQGPKSLRIILATRDIATRTWFHTTINDLLAAYQPLTNTSDLTIEVHVTGEAERILNPATTKAKHSHPSHDLERSTTSTSSSSISDDSSRAYPTTAKNLHKVTTNSAEATATAAAEEDEVRGRPNLPHIIRVEADDARAAGQNVGVFVCGPLTMQNDVRNAVAAENLRIVSEGGSGGMYLHLEHFSWA